MDKSQVTSCTDAFAYVIEWMLLQFFSINSLWRFLFVNNFTLVGFPVISCVIGDIRPLFMRDFSHFDVACWGFLHFWRAFNQQFFFFLFSNLLCPFLSRLLSHLRCQQHRQRHYNMAFVKGHKIEVTYSCPYDASTKRMKALRVYPLGKRAHLHEYFSSISSCDRLCSN